MPHEDKDDSDLTPEQLHTRQLIKEVIEELAETVHGQQRRRQQRRREAKQAKATE